jgi:hypothetical protein
MYAEHPMTHHASSGLQSLHNYAVPSSRPWNCLEREVSSGQPAGDGVVVETSTGQA